jgi:undecaprenyl-diphosphatase
VTSEAAKHIFTRARPTQTDDPNQWFQGSGHYSFPSGEVTLVSAAVSPFVFEYAHDHPWILALEALPLYDAIARVKAQSTSKPPSSRDLRSAQQRAISRTHATVGSS